MHNQPPESQRIQKKTRQIKSLFIIIISIGLVTGGIVAFGVVNILNKFGLTDNEPQLENIQQR